MLKILPLIFLISACSWLEREPATFYLTKPPRPVLPPIEESALECLPLEVYSLLRLRDAKRRWYTEELEAIIDSTKKR